MLNYIFAFFSIFLLAGSFAGWGGVIGRVLLGPGQGDLGERTAWGIAGTVVLGGVANLSRLISGPVLLGYAAIGLVLFLVDLPRWARRDEGPVAAPARLVPRIAVRVCFGAVLILVLVRVAASAHTIRHQFLDDHFAYLAFPHQMLQTGGLTPDPYCNRRLVATLGGMPLLNAFALCVFREQSVGLIDQGVGLLGILLIAGGLMRSRGLTRAAWIVPAGILVIDRPPVFNLAGMLIPTLLLLAIHRALGLDPESRWAGRAVLLGLLTGALFALKSTMIPLAFFLFALDYAPRVARRSSWRALPVEVATGLACLIPWMIALKESSGTWLYPLLGRGVEGARGGTFLPPNHDFTPAFLLRNFARGFSEPMALSTFLFSAAALASLAGRGAKSEGRRPEDVAILLAPWPSLILLLVMFDRVQVIRYIHPIDVATIVVATAVLLRPGVGARRRLRHAMMAVGCFAFFAGARITEMHISYRIAASQIVAGLRGRPYVSPVVRDSYARMQAAVPEGAPILTHLADSYLVDFRRNPIYLADWPGGASPPPKMPIFEGPEPLAEYLSGQGIRYLAYSYAEGERFHANRLPKDGSVEVAAWDRIVDRHAEAFRDLLGDLMRSRRRAFDDGALVVIDLATRAP